MLSPSSVRYLADPSARIGSAVYHNLNVPESAIR
jgi:hypothetical protein